MDKDKRAKCEFYPTDGDCVCDCGSDISGRFVCTEKYSKTCRWANEQRNTVTETGKGTKHDQGKLRMDLIPVYPLREWAAILTKGAEKYDDRNWEKGMAWSRVYAATLRHLLAFWDGADFDPESGQPHLAHAMCCLSFLLEYSRTHGELDDRPSTVPMCVSCGHQGSIWKGPWSYACLTCGKSIPRRGGAADANKT